MPPDQAGNPANPCRMGANPPRGLPIAANRAESTNDGSIRKRSLRTRTKEHYRLNMPFEIGIDFGCRRFGSERLSEKVFLVLEEKQYRYQAAISDLAGFDIKSHNGNPARAVRQLCNWIKDQGLLERLEASRVYSEYEDFRGWNLKMRRAEGASEEDLRDSSTVELMRAMREWFEIGSPRN